MINAIVSFDPPMEESEHIVEREGIGKVISTTGGVLLGKMSFKMTADEFDISGFGLVTDTNSPTTGIKINLNIIEAYEEQSTFRFIDETASKDATLSNILLSSEEVNVEDPISSTYKEYALTPAFNKDTLDYELKLLEYIDNMNLTAIKSDEKATMKISLPSRDEDDKLLYDSSGEILYEEKTLDSNVPLEISLNKLGEPDTILTITVTAEDKVTTNEYSIKIIRPYGTITGQIQTYNTDDIHKATVKLYKTGEIEWEDYYVSYNDVYTHDDLPEPLKYIETQEDGTFLIYVVPGTYEIMIDKECHFDHIITNNEIKESDTKDFGTINLIPGDINKDGMIDAKDFNSIKLYFGQDYIIADIDESGTVDAPDFNAVKLRFGQSIEIY